MIINRFKIFLSTKHDGGFHFNFEICAIAAMFAPVRLRNSAWFLFATFQVFIRKFKIDAFI